MNAYDQDTNDGRATVVTGTLLWRLLFPVAGVGLGLLVKSAAAWIVALPFAPFQGPLELLESLPEPGATIGAGALGGLAGVVLAFLDHHHMLGLAVSAERAVLRRRGGTDEVDRSVVNGVFLDGKVLVLVGSRSEELVRVPCDLDADAVRTAFASHGWPWHEEDPHGADFRRWVDGLPELSTRANALLKARGEALENDAEDDAEELRRELVSEGVAVRDEKKRQYWRPTGV